MRMVISSGNSTCRERPEELKLLKEGWEGRTETGLRREGGEYQEEESRGRIFPPLQ